MFDHLLESSQWDDSNKRSIIGFTEERAIIETKIRTLSRAWPLPRLNFASGYDTDCNIAMVQHWDNSGA